MTGDESYILDDEILEESMGRCGGDSFSTFIIHCKQLIRREIKDNGEILIKDFRYNSKEDIRDKLIDDILK